MIEGLIQNLSDHEETGTAQNATESCLPEQTYTPEALPSAWRNHPVLCVAGRGALDEAAALLLVQLLEKRGIGARMISSKEASAARIPDLDVSGVCFVCLSHLGATGGAQAHYLMRRLRRRIPDAQAIAGFWGLTDDDSRFLDAFGATEAEVVTTFQEALARIMAAIEAPLQSFGNQPGDLDTAQRPPPVSEAAA